MRRRVIGGGRYIQDTVEEGYRRVRRRRKVYSKLTQ